MKLSRYVCAYGPVKSGETLLYNSLNKSVVLSDNPTYTDAKKLASDVESGNMPADELAVLKDENFICQGPDEDFSKAKEIFEAYKNDREALNITYLPTYACNMKCSYCFERSLDTVRSPATQDYKTLLSSIAFINSKLDALEPKKLNLTLFGGEPFLCRNNVLLLAGTLFEKTKSSRVDLNIDAVTNGTLLDRDVVSRLKGFGLNQIKVTLDGTREFHDRKRKYKNGDGTFEKIIENVEGVSDLVDIFIGINFDDENEAGIIPLIDFLSRAPFRKSIKAVSIKPVMYDASPETPKSRLSCSQTIEDFRRSYKYIRYAKMTGFETFDRIHVGPCDANRCNSFTIDPKGNIYICPASVGYDDLVVGSVVAGCMNDNYDRYLKASPFDVAECSSCKYLPMCYGSCRLMSYFKTKNFNGVNCEKRYFEVISPALLRLEIEDN